MHHSFEINYEFYISTESKALIQLIGHGVIDILVLTPLKDFIKEYIKDFFGLPRQSMSGTINKINKMMEDISKKFGDGKINEKTYIAACKDLDHFRNLIVSNYKQNIVRETK